ncbi:lactate dehydrogenase [Streptomyces violascens]|uniref:lactate/malate family dehydrogenase n=1 Tax=Streptomyces violascens TaxID=67381 RepID=UPI0037B46479
MTGVRVGVIGAGAVGQTVSVLLAASSWCTHITVTSRTESAAVGLATDLEDMAAVIGSPVRVSTTTAPADLVGCDALVVCPRAPFTNVAKTDVRMAGLATNAPLIAGLARALRGYTGVVIVVTNPVDLMTRLVADISGVEKVFGIGSHTDTARYRLTLARCLDVPLDAVGGHVVGEHGDLAIAIATTVHGQVLAAVPPGVGEEATARPARINAGIGRTRCGPAGAVLAALTHALGLTDGVLELCAPHRGHWIGVPVRFTAGIPVVCLPDLAPPEAAALAAATSKLATAYGAIAPHPNRKEPAL